MSAVSGSRLFRSCPEACCASLGTNVAPSAEKKAVLHTFFPNPYPPAFTLYAAGTEGRVGVAQEGPADPHRAGRGLGKIRAGQGVLPGVPPPPHSLSCCMHIRSEESLRAEVVVRAPAHPSPPFPPPSPPASGFSAVRAPRCACPWITDLSAFSHSHSQSLAIMGPSGTGKTTLIDCLLGV